MAEYSCSASFSLEGDTIRVCQSDGTWSGEQPVCLAGIGEDTISNTVMTHLAPPMCCGDFRWLLCISSIMCI